MKRSPPRHVRSTYDFVYSQAHLPQAGAIPATELAGASIL